MFSLGWTRPLSDGFVYFNDSNGRDSQGPIEATVAPAALGARFFPTTDPKVTYWTPTLAQVFKLDTARDLVVQKEPKIAEHLFDYRYQIVGINDGSKRVFVNAFCRDPRGDQRSPNCRYAFSHDSKKGWVERPPNSCPVQEWLYQPVWVKDGGACYFNFKYDPETGAISELLVNGEA